MIARRDIYQAIADPTRRGILTLLAAGSMTSSAIASHFDTARQTVSQHLQILTECQLLVQTQQGREITYHLNLQKLNEIENWLNQFKSAMENRLDSLEQYLQEIQSESHQESNMENQIENFEISHAFESDVQKVFDMWTNPKHFSHWLGPDGAKMAFITTNVKEGKSSRWTMTTNDGMTKYGLINFKIIKPNHLLVYTQNFCDEKGNFVKAPFSDTYPDYLLTTVNFSNEANKTIVKVKWEIFGDATEEERRTFTEFKEMMKMGWTASFQKLEKLLK